MLYVDDLAAGVSEAAKPLSPVCGLQGKRFVWQVQLFSWRLGFSVVVRHVCGMACVRACVRACARVCVCACVCVCVQQSFVCSNVRDSISRTAMHANL